MSDENLAVPFLYFSHLPPDVTEADLLQATSHFGYVVSVLLVAKNREGFVQLASAAQVFSPSTTVLLILLFDSRLPTRFNFSSPLAAPIFADVSPRCSSGFLPSPFLSFQTRW